VPLPTARSLLPIPYSLLFALRHGTANHRAPLIYRDSLAVPLVRRGTRFRRLTATSPVNAEPQLPPNRGGRGWPPSLRGLERPCHHRVGRLRKSLRDRPPDSHVTPAACSFAALYDDLDAPKAPAPRCDDMTTTVPPVLQYSVACRKVEQSKPGIFTLHEVSNAYGASRSNPAVLCFIVNCWTDGEGEWQDQVVIYRPNGEEAVRTTPVTIKLIAAEAQHVVVHQLVVAVQEEGLYPVEVLLGSQTVARYRLRLTLRDAPAPAT
jgi:hypothetical protein